VVVESHDDFPGVEISIAGGVGEMVRGLTTVTESPSYRLFTPTTLTLVTHNSSHAVLSLLMSHARNPSDDSYESLRNMP